MINADLFKAIFGLYATELWAKPEKDFLNWLNSPVQLTAPKSEIVDCISRRAIKELMLKYGFTAPNMTVTEFVEDILPPMQKERIMDTNIKINCETKGFEEATEQAETLAEAYDGFPAQVTVKNCHHCTFNIYPSQTRFVDVERKTDE